jgi:hypothetical protein
MAAQQHSDIVVVGRIGAEVAACAGTTTDCTIGRDQDLGSTLSAAAVMPIALSTGLRFVSPPTRASPPRYQVGLWQAPQAETSAFGLAGDY